MNYVSDEIKNNIPDELKRDLEYNQDLVQENIRFLRELGIENYQEIFKLYYPMFLMDASNFQEIFNKYEKADLIDKINKNIAIIEHL